MTPEQVDTLEYRVQTAFGEDCLDIVERDVPELIEGIRRLQAEIEQLKLEKAEIVEVLRKSLNLEYLTRLVCALDFARTYEDFESRQLRLNSLREQVQAVIAKHGVSL